MKTLRILFFAFALGIAIGYAAVRKTPTLTSTRPFALPPNAIDGSQTTTMTNPGTGQDVIVWHNVTPTWGITS